MTPKTNVVDKKFGVSFSVKQCRSFGIDPKRCLTWLIQDAGFRRFRLMSYWNEIEKSSGHYDFSALDWQIKMISKAGGEISLCLGARQPRWPENHWPEWAWKSSKKKRTEALLTFIQKVVERHKDEPAIVSYQLENEALLRHFGKRAEVDRKRLVKEYKLVKRLDPKRPIIMTTSTTWGIPSRRPVPDIVGFSYYQVLYRSDLGRYTRAFHKPWMHRVRALSIKLLWNRPSFIHELQLEPWGPKNIWEMSSKEQNKSMGLAQIKQNLQLAKATGLYPIDLWGGEWWYWRLKHRDEIIWRTVKEELLS
jgi:hypothetical protein